MSVHFYRGMQTLTGRDGLRAEVYTSLSGKGARIEIWDAHRRLDTRRATPLRATERARALLTFWAGGRI
jgi:hypothetical protein